MACYHPLKAFPIGFHESGKPKYKIVSYKTDVAFDYYGNPVYDAIEIPCGRCIGCRLAYSRQWADRCMLELIYHEESWFVTLTYNDEHLPISHPVDLETGEVLEHINNATLNKRDVQLFLKRLRKNYQHDNHLMYFCAGEYGSTTYRPHYHLIIFGLKLDDLVPYKQHENGYMYYNSPFLDKCWQHKGHVVIGRVNWDTCAYTARYIMKKQYGDAAEIYQRYNIVPEFTLMSRKPAIGKKYFEDNVDEIFSTEKIFLATDEGGISIKPPRYYERLFEHDFPDEYLDLKEDRRELQEDFMKLKQDSTSLPYLKMLANEELVKESQIEILRRKEI